VGGDIANGHPEKLPLGLFQDFIDSASRWHRQAMHRSTKTNFITELENCQPAELPHEKSYFGGFVASWDNLTGHRKDSGWPEEMRHDEYPE
jgi:hypothetical protein